MTRQDEIDKIDKILENHVFVGTIKTKDGGTLTMDKSVRIAIAKDIVDNGIRSKDGFEIDRDDLFVTVRQYTEVVPTSREGIKTLMARLCFDEFIKPKEYKDDKPRI